jgi:nucleotide-binding universal stress UspA family protein
MYRKILVASDGSTTAAKAVDRAAEVAQATGATVTVLTVGKAQDKALATAKKEAERVTAATNGAVTPQVKTDDGDPSEVILDEATSGGYDLLVVGNKGMTGASRFLLGSVPNKVSHHAPCALLIVRTT